MLCVLHYDGAQVEARAAIDHAWLQAFKARQTPSMLWVDLAAPTADEGRVLSEVFGFHELAIEDALSVLHHPKIEGYESYFYLILHGIDFRVAQRQFATHDIDFFIGPGYLVTVHDGQTRSIAHVRRLCEGRGEHFMAEGPAALAHRIIDSMVHNYRPEVEKLEDQLDELEQCVMEDPAPQLMQTVLALRRDLANLRRVVLPQRDVVARLARREFPAVSEAVGYRFRDVYDQLVRLSDEALFFQERAGSLLEAHLASASNRLSAVMKVLAVIATVFMPLTVVTGLYGMNVPLPEFPGGPDAQFLWVLGIMSVLVVAMLWFFRSHKWL